MSRVFVICEAACTWLFGDKPLENAYRSIRAAKDCGADAWKTQWTSDPLAMGKRRWSNAILQSRFESPDQLAEKYKRLAWPREWLPLLKAECDRVGIEFLCTVFLAEDVCKIHHLVARGKVSAFEYGYRELLSSWHGHGKRVIQSFNPEHKGDIGYGHWKESLYCVSKYPTELGDLHLKDGLNGEYGYDGLSDHTTSTLTGAVAVGAGARIIEHHFRLDGTPETDPDFPHSFEPARLKTYISNIREAEVML